MPLDREHRPLSVAPMMDWTDRHFRSFLRCITRRATLYTEMVTANAIRFGDREKLLGFDPEENPLVLQLGGDDPAALAEAARIAADFGYREFNLNVGCPSDRVQNGSFGACLMERPERVAECVAAIRRAVNLPVTVKHRIGIASPARGLSLEAYADLARFVEIVSGESDCERFIVHARIAVLEGLSPKDNRDVPPLRYKDVLRLKADFSNLNIELNGGVRNLETAADLLKGDVAPDGIMLGRAAYETPWIFARADSAFYGAGDPSATRREVLERLIPRFEALLDRGERPHAMLRHVLGLFAGEPGARAWRRYLSEKSYESLANPRDAEAILKAAAEKLPAHVLESPGAGLAVTERIPVDS